MQHSLSVSDHEHMYEHQVYDTNEKIQKSQFLSSEDLDFPGWPQEGSAGSHIAGPGPSESPENQLNSAPVLFVLKQQQKPFN